jgi:septum formation protein
MRRLTKDELESYVAGGAWRGKAGAYGIQDRDDPFVQSIEGSFTNVVGLPMELLECMLAEWRTKS